jgi:hypothetical protein
MNKIKTFEQFVSDKYGETTNESLVGTAVATSMMMRKSRSGSSGSSYYSSNDDNHSKGAKIINAIIKTIFTAGGFLLIGPFANSCIGIIVLVVICVGIFGNFKAFIDKNILRNNLDESLINEELITEGKLKDFLQDKIIDAAMKHEKIKEICEEVMKRDDFKEAQNENSIKKLVKCVASYFKENKDREKEFTQLQSELKDEK